MATVAEQSFFVVAARLKNCRPGTGPLDSTPGPHSTPDSHATKHTSADTYHRSPTADSSSRPTRPCTGHSPGHRTVLEATQATTTHEPTRRHGPPTGTTGTTGHSPPSSRQQINATFQNQKITRFPTRRTLALIPTSHIPIYTASQHHIPFRNLNKLSAGACAG